MRRPEDMVDELLGKGTPWQGILAVARFARGGSWRSRVEDILVERGAMPADVKERNRLQDKFLIESKKAKVVEEEMELQRRRERREIRTQKARGEAACQDT